MLTAAFTVAAGRTWGRRYIRPQLEMYESEYGVYLAQSVIYPCRDALSTTEWRNYDWYEDNDLVMTEQTSPQMQMFERDLREMGYHIEVAISGKVVYSNFDAADREYLIRHVGSPIPEATALTLATSDGAAVRNSFDPNHERGSITAVCRPGRAAMSGQSYLHK